MSTEAGDGGEEGGDGQQQQLAFIRGRWLVVLMSALCSCSDWGTSYFDCLADVRGASVILFVSPVPRRYWATYSHSLSLPFLPPSSIPTIIFLFLGHPPNRTDTKLF
jgi:hypothetical protein